jgi:hypothetical protein
MQEHLQRGLISEPFALRQFSGLIEIGLRQPDRDLYAALFVHLLDKPGTLYFGSAGFALGRFRLT